MADLQPPTHADGFWSWAIGILLSALIAAGGIIRYFFNMKMADYQELKTKQASMEAVLESYRKQLTEAVKEIAELRVELRYTKEALNNKVNRESLPEDYKQSV